MENRSDKTWEEGITNGCQNKERYKILSKRWIPRLTSSAEIGLGTFVELWPLDAKIPREGRCSRARWMSERLRRMPLGSWWPSSSEQPTSTEGPTRTWDSRIS